MLEQDNSDSFIHSEAAADTLTLFHRKKYVVFVEGSDDMVFWTKVFEACSVDSYTIKIAGGALEIDKYTTAVLTKGTDVVVCRDQDYALYDGKFIDHNRVIYTLGYSIENTLYSAANIKQLIGDYARDYNLDLKEVEEWIEEFTSKCDILLAYDLANHLFVKSIKIMGDNCGQYLHDRKPSVCPVKTAKAIDVFQTLIPQDEFVAARSAILADDRPLWMIIRGHFLTQAVHRYIKTQVHKLCGRSVSISLDNLFVGFVGQFCHTGWDSKDMTYIRDRVDRLVRS